jgi:adhesin transport system outer membrane protein
MTYFFDIFYNYHLLMNKKAVITILLLGILTTSAPGQTLSEAIQLMLDYEPELLAAERDTLSAEKDHEIAKAELRPHVTANGLAGYTQRDRSVDGLSRSDGDALFSRQLGVSLRQLLYDGGMTSKQTKSAEHSWKAQEFLERGHIESRVVDLTEVYMEVIRTGRQVDLAKENVENHRKMRDKLKERAQNGGSRADVALVEGRLGLAVNSQQTQQLARNIAVSRFERLVGRRPSVLDYPAIPALGDSLEQVNLANNWNFLAANQALAAAMEKAEMMKGNRMPKLYLDLGASKGQDIQGIEGEDDELRAYIVGSWDLYRGGANKALRDREDLQVQKFQELLRSADLERRHQTDILWQERQGSLVSVETLETYSTELKSVASDYQEQFSIGRQELLNILDVQSEYYSARSKLLDARFDADMGVFRLLGVQGLLTTLFVGEDSVRQAIKGSMDASAPLNPVSQQNGRGLSPANPLIITTSASEVTEPAPDTRKGLLRGLFRKNAE